MIDVKTSTPSVGILTTAIATFEQKFAAITPGEYPVLMANPNDSTDLVYCDATYTGDKK
ncbi:MAG: hypothetical protein HUJ51_01610 [Eggerthellaceae bacterium]|nr:hypothetical protein [Eggerthellaceae bacterium]